VQQQHLQLQLVGSPVLLPLLVMRHVQLLLLHLQHPH
jgi:hypothetical protein